MAIKAVLREELQNSIDMIEQYEKLMAALPKGSLVKRVIKGNEYYYLVYREKGKVCSEYRGKPPAKELARYGKAKEKRAQYRKALSLLRKQVKFLKGALRGREEL